MKNIVRIAVFCAVLWMTFVDAQQKPLDVATLPAFWRLNFELIDMPDSRERKMGLLGINYLVDFEPWLYAGVAGYGVVSGERGGLFTLGFEGGVQHEFLPHLSANAGMFVGGGGGHTAVVGGGLMLRPHAGISYDLRYFQLGLDVSKVQFPTGHINSNQLAVNLSIPTEITYRAVDDRYGNVNYNHPQQQYFDFTQYYISLLGQAYLQYDARDEDMVKDSSNLGLVGIEIDRFFTSSWFGLVKTAGAFSGRHNGYMDVFGGVGYRYLFPEFSALALNGRFAVGMGGGGKVDVGGGLLLEPSVGLQYQFTRDVGAEVAAGYLYAPDGRFNALTLTGRVTYALSAGSVAPKTVANFSERYLQAWRVQAFNQTYFRPQRKNSNEQRDLELVGFQIDAFVTPYFYIAGQATSAYAGKAGGYSTGMLGAGAHTPAYHKFDADAEVLFGAGGGGGIDVSGGALVHPNISVNYHFTPYLAAKAAVGRIISFGGNLNATTLNLGLTFNFATVDGKKQ